MRRLRLAAGFFLATLATACGCKADLGWNVDPLERSLAIGESFTPNITVLSCGGTTETHDDFTWSPADTTIVHVDAATGRTTGIRVGTTVVTPVGKKWGEAPSVRVTVFAP